MATLSDWKLSVDRIPLPQGPESPQSLNAYNCSVQRVGGYLYVLGRLSRSSNILPVIGVLDIRRRKWMAIPFEGFMVYLPHAFLYDDGLYVYASRDWNADRSGKVSRFDLIEEEWSYCHTTGTNPMRPSYCTGDYLEKHNCFVTFGGIGSNTDVHVLCMPEKKWFQPKAKGQPPAGRRRHGSCVYQDVIYYYGGRSAGFRQNDGMFLLTFTRRDVATWSLVQSTVGSYIRLSSLAMFSFNGKILLCGGCTDDGVYHGLSTFDPKTETFEKVRVVGDFGEGLSAFTIDRGRSFGLICGRQKLKAYDCLSIVKKS